MITIQIITIIIAFLSVYFLCKDLLMSIFATIIYFTNPYRIYLCYDLRDFKLALFWALLPLLFLTQKFKATTTAHIIIQNAGIITVMSILFYLNPSYAVVIGSLYAFFSLCNKKWLNSLSFCLSLVISLPVVKNYWRFILLNHQNDYSVPLMSITNNGYKLGYFFYSWSYHDGRPGLGFGLLISIFVMLWLYLTSYGNKDESPQKSLSPIFPTLFMTILATKLFLWDYAERIHPIFLRFISSIGSPAIFFGFATSYMCYFASNALSVLWNSDYKYLNKIIPAFTIFMSILACGYMISMH